MSIETKTLYSRASPFLARLKDRKLLSGEGSTKEVYHISLTIKESELDFRPGDAVAVLPENDPLFVDPLLEALHLSGREPVLDPRTKEALLSRDFFLKRAHLGRLSLKFLKAVAPALDDPALSSLCQEDRKEELTAFLDATEPVDLLKRAKKTFTFEEISPHFLPLLPRFFSIASSTKIYSDEIHLLLSVPAYWKKGEKRFGTATHFLCHLAKEESSIPLYIQRAPHFYLPSDPQAPLILIGPGTGVAPFRAFLQERQTASPCGKQWLFFGERSRCADFYYEEEWKREVLKGRLRLDLAFSRDQDKKIYVQDRMCEHGKELWLWLQEGAFLYICGDAQKMAKAVHAALLRIVEKEGGLSAEEAAAYLKRLRCDKRYCLDIY
ncbi:MAG: hypothetical protein A2Y28_03240 [Chlamydiae bacterium GWC2_50_10]|nr:MAG: hypothetical protein A2Z85_01675 [Chlamydiae bacterium GWA2_50_15]OGN54270.1 MAG: hypothetical protein A2Y28_03240 [Chlamydiae bacterium GWC2_50_10]OGN55039.1 MAG: hypothetical protein A2098_02290 [Chlamydiae bacterium GWF2_49_8]OGN58795.1 MAG: hypothetical protein A3D18_06225 [Chlamydiae bacterium RIFCSPHIGHO2_02_FULL_49_29]OGN64017.1 MAG: hypothetical protein A3E26_02775 [Chlamydiae bacterium RIFCSPHIGHO2_12_FULL_49_32]OGN68403.1 MAG: hypothetical protein A3I15_04465 [Chlamydiae bact